MIEIKRDTNLRKLLIQKAIVNIVLIQKHLEEIMEHCQEEQELLDLFQTY